MTNWAEVRACLLGEFRPHALTEAGPAAARLWDELKVVSTVNAWRSTSALAGQLLELLLKQAVIDRGGSRRFAREPLGPVLAEAQRLGIFSPPTEALTVASTIYAAKELRNIASHGSPWQQEDTERRATYSLVFLVFFSGYLYPRPRLEGILSREDPPVDERSLLDPVEEEPAPRTSAPMAGTIDDRVRGSSPRGVLRLARSLTSEPKGLEELVASVRTNFGFVIENAGFGRVRSVYELARWLQDRGLSAHARCCGILLPHDSEALEWLSSRAPITFGKYLFECRRAEPRLFDRRFNKSGADTVARIAADWLERPDISITNSSRLLDMLPVGSLGSFFTTYRTQILDRLADSRSTSSVALLKPLVKARGLSRSITRSICDGIVSTARTEAPDALQALPLRLVQLQVIEHELSDGLVDILLQGVGHDFDIASSQRICWDLYSMSQRHARAAVDAATERVRRMVPTSDPWSELLMWSIGIASGTTPRLSFDTSRLAPAMWPDGNKDLFQQLRVGYVLVRSDVPLPVSRIRHLKVLADSTVVRVGPGYANSVDFISKCRAAFSVG